MPTVMRIESPIMASKPELLSPDQDVFVSRTPTSNHHRFTYFDNELFALNSKTSPNQAKRALEAHLAETERRIQDASRLGTTLLQQRKNLEGRLEEVEKQQTEENISPELRLKLVQLEKEYNEVGRESARAFLSKSRASGTEFGASNYTGEFKRPISPSKESLECQGIASPSKINTFNRRHRNQPSNRIHDIEFATEISTSLLTQVRRLQGLLSEKEDHLKSVVTEKLKLEADVENLTERVRSLDESGERYKDENWSLETQIHELIAKDKETADRERRLIQSLNILQAEKSAAQKDLDEVKSSYAKLSDDHTAAIKHYDVELGILKRNLTMTETEKGALQRKIDDLLNQNKELATAFVHHRARLEGLEQNQGLVEENLELAPDDLTPEHSPPPSPVKGTPRHAMLESETLKSSLQHAHRMIQNLKSIIQREKAEKLDLKRLLQDARDELEIRRNDIGSTMNRKPRKLELKETKKQLRITHLGGLRSNTREVHIEDPNWEDDDSGPMSPSPAIQKSSIPLSLSNTLSIPENSLHAGNNFPAKNRDSVLLSIESETTDAFQKAHEKLSPEELQVNRKEKSEDLTEIEDVTDQLISTKANHYLMSPGNRLSFQSTASISDDDFENSYRGKSSSNTIQPSRLRLRVGHSGHRRSRISSIDSQSYASPVSINNTSRDVTPHEKGISLFAELGNMCGTDDDEPTLESPSITRDSSRSPSPISRQSNNPDTLPSKSLTTAPSMIDSGMITEPWEPIPVAKQIHTSLLSNSGTGTEHAIKPSNFPIRSQVSKITQTDLMIQIKHASCQWNEENLCMDDSKSNSRPASPHVSNNAKFNYNFDFFKSDESRFELPRLSESGDLISAVSLDSTHKSMKPVLSLSEIISEEFEPCIPVTPLKLIFEENPKTLTAPRPKSTLLTSAPLFETKKLQSHCYQIDSASQLRRSSCEEAGSRGSGVQSFDMMNLNFVSECISSPKFTPAREKYHDMKFIPCTESVNHKNSLQLTSKDIYRFNSNTLQSTDECSQTSLTGKQIDELLKSKRKLSIPDHDNEFSLEISRTTRKNPLISGVNIGSSNQVIQTTETSEFESNTAPVTETTGISGSKNSSSSPYNLQTPCQHEAQVTMAENFVSPLGAAELKARELLPISTCRSNLTCRPISPILPLPISTQNDEATPRIFNSLGVATSQLSTRNLRSRVSSVSSFASEMNNRFQIQNTIGVSAGIPTGTDPRMINAITQTMIGEYLWKYTRKTGRGAMSEKRHRRYFWVHPYTKTLYWCDRDPSSAGRAELKAKSVPIEAVRVVTDDNPMPPGLHRKSLIILTPSRAVKFTATTGKLHETWFNSLSYLLMRTGGEKHEIPLESLNDSITADDMVDFNPENLKNNQGGISSLSSHHTRTTKNEYSKKSLTNRSIKPPRTSSGTISRFGNYLKPSKEGLMGSVTSRQSKISHEKMENLYQSNQIDDSAEELRKIIEQQEREADKLENVRACCDGRHDVGHLSNSTKSRNCRNSGATYSSRHDCPGVRFESRTKQ